MRNSKALAKLRANQPIKLAYMGHFIPIYVAHAAANGFDAIWFDLEHRAMEAREVQAILPICHLYDIDCIIRTPTREKTQLYRYLEDGATGFIVPLINNAEEARDIVNKVKFPPLGDRGLEGKGLDASYGLDITDNATRQAFVEHANRETILILQLESPAAMQQAEAVAAVEGVDIIFAGPTDFDIRAPHDPQAMSWSDALDLMADAAKKQGKAWGVMPRHLDHVKEYYQRGAQFIPYAIDANLIINGLKNAGKELSEVYGG